MPIPTKKNHIIKMGTIFVVALMIILVVLFVFNLVI
jgi:hypothetical protein